MLSVIELIVLIILTLIMLNVFGSSFRIAWCLSVTCRRAECRGAVCLTAFRRSSVPMTRSKPIQGFRIINRSLPVYFPPTKWPTCHFILSIDTSSVNQLVYK